MSELNQRTVAALGELADELVEQAGPTSDFIYVDIGSIDRETKKITEAKGLTLSQAPSRAKQLLRAGDVLVSMTRPNLNAVALVPGRLDGAIGSTGFHVLRSRWLRPEFLLRLVQSQRFVDEMSALVQGALYPAVRPKDIAAFTFTFETPAQQSRIIAKLEELLTDLDAGVAELKAAQKKLAQYRQSLLKAAVEGALTAEWRAKHKPTETGAQLLEHILTERRARWEAKQLAKFAEQGKTPPKDWQKKYPEPVQPDTTDLPELPEGWVWASAEMLFSWGSGDFLPASAQIDGRYPVYGGNGINGRHNAANVAHSTIVIGRVGVHCGNVYLTESSAWVTDNAIYATSKHERIMWPYAELVMQAARLGSSSKGGAQPFISQKILNDTVVALPSVEEQDPICDEYTIALKASMVMEQNIELSLKQSTAQRQNILRAAFSGQLVPQDPNDEPASVLLERIRTERAEREKQPKARKTKQLKEIAAVVSKLIDVLAEAGDWVPAQEAFRRCGVADGALTDRIEELYAELRKLDKAGRLAVEAVTDAQGRKLYDKLKLLAA